MRELSIIHAYLIGRMNIFTLLTTVKDRSLKTTIIQDS